MNGMEPWAKIGLFVVLFLEFLLSGAWLQVSGKVFTFVGERRDERFDFRTDIARIILGVPYLPFCLADCCAVARE